MNCPFCNSSKTDVINSRKTSDGDGVWRRRKCLKCCEVYTTTEYFSHDSLFVVKRNLVRKKFVYEKLFASIFNAVIGGKIRDQGDDAARAKRLTGEIIGEIIKLRSKYVATKEIVAFAYKVLEKENHFFATRYAMYSEFRAKVVFGNKK